MEVEKQVTFPVETALAGIPGPADTRSLSRNGFSQVTAVFDDDVDIYFARQQVNERLGEASEKPAARRRADDGPDLDGPRRSLHVDRRVRAPRRQGRDVSHDGKPGWQSDGTYLTPEGQCWRRDVELAAYLRTVQDWIIRPQLKGVKDVAGVDAIGGYVKQYHVQPDPMKLVSYGLTFQRRDRGAGAEQRQHRRGLRRAQGRELSSSARPAGSRTRSRSARSCVGTRGGTPIHVRDVATRRRRPRAAHRLGQRERRRGRRRHRADADRREQPHRRRRRRREDDGRSTRRLPPDIRAKTVLNRTKLVDATIETVEREPAEGAILVIVVLFLLLGNIRAALITALAIPLSMLMTATGMVQSKISGNLMSLGAIDFGLIVDGAVIIVENCLRRLAEQQHELGRTLDDCPSGCTR